VKRLEDKGVNALSIVHKVIGALWFVCALVVLVFVMPLAGGAVRGAAFWDRVILVQRVAAYCSVATLLVGLAYGLWTYWGFARYPRVIGKWALFLLATALNGPTIVFGRSHSAVPILALTAAELVVLGISAGLGSYLAQGRKVGRLAQPPGEEE
jgi:hypothetical protein